jgi:hypothetical protein
MVSNGRPQAIITATEMETPVPVISMDNFDLEGPLDWLDSSLPTYFGLDEAGQARDIWDMFDIDVQGM